MASFHFSKILCSHQQNSPLKIRISQYGKENTQYVKMILSRKVIEELQLKGKMIEFLSDPSKSSLAFRILSSVNQKEFNKRTMKIVNPAPSNGAFQISIGRLLASSSIKVDNYLCPLNKYEDNVYGTLYYIELNGTTKTVISRRKAAKNSSSN